MALLVFMGTLFLFLAIGVPVAISLTGCAFVLMVFLDLFDPVTVAQQMVAATNNFALMAIPFFMLAGEIMSTGGLSRRIVDAANLAVGRINGGLGYTCILASILFAGLSGSAIADAAALGAILMPLMVANGYRKERAVGLVCSSSIIAPIIPPSIPMIVMGTTVGLSISKMFMSGIIPGIIMGVALMVVWFFVVRKDGYKDIKKYGFKEGLKLLLESIPALFMPVLIIGGIRMGIFTPTEAGAFACVYAILVCLFIYRELNLKQLYRALVASAKSTATVMFIVAAASAVGYMITVAKVPGLVVSMCGPLIDHPYLLLVAINLFLFVMGMVMDVTPNILIFAPVLFPVIRAAGINEYAFALIMVLNLCIGLLTPPVGIVLYVGSSISRLNVTRVVAGVIPFLLIEIAILFLFIFFPSLILVPLGWLT